MSSPPSLVLVLIVYEMQPTDSSQPSIFTLLCFSAYNHCASCTLGSLSAVGWIGGYACDEPQAQWKHASYLSPHLRQSVKRAELQAVIDVVDRYKSRPISVAVATDFAYVHDGLQGRALQWNPARWVISQGSAEQNTGSSLYF